MTEPGFVVHVVSMRLFRMLTRVVPELRVMRVTRFQVVQCGNNGKQREPRFTCLE